jgi:DNA polymerase/3'-5' exonuclease PolX
MAKLNPEQIRRLARLGAVTRLEQLRQEESAIRAEFPELFGRGRRQDTGSTRPEKSAGRRRRRVKMTAAQKKAVSERMRKYWADRRKGK